jgi:hypothetical protein
VSIAGFVAAALVLAFADAVTRTSKTQRAR